MDIIENGNISSTTIHFLRKSMISDTLDVKHYLGVSSSNVRSVLPIKTRDFNTWVFFHQGSVVGFITFKDEKYGIKFLKEFYVHPEYRNKGYGKKILLRFYSQHHKIECKINPGNERMYRIAKIINLRGERSEISKRMKDLDIPPIWWSNYKANDKYI